MAKGIEYTPTVPDLKGVERDGFTLRTHGQGSTRLALLSLRAALRAYFSTYREIESILLLFESPYAPDSGEQYSPGYLAACAETITHFQHFAELITKDALGEHHPLLVLEVANRHTLLDRLLSGESVGATEYESANTIKFTDALARVRELVKGGRFRAAGGEIIARHFDTLQALNRMRNSLAHRGAFLLHYPALDALVGRFVLPFMREIVALPAYAGSDDLWRYPPLVSGIDPLDGIAASMAGGTYEIGRVGVLKELARASYENPLSGRHVSGSYRFRLIERAERIAQEEVVGRDPGVWLRDCPVCGTQARVTYVHPDFEPDDEGRPYVAAVYPMDTMCFCCTFSVDYGTGGSDELGPPLDTLWE